MFEQNASRCYYYPNGNGNGNPAGAVDHAPRLSDVIELMFFTFIHGIKSLLSGENSADKISEKIGLIG